jgi:hypothetical protein
VVNQYDALDEFHRYRNIIRTELALEPTPLLGDLVRDLGPGAA